jgi:hypothetical protein
MVAEVTVAERNFMGLGLAPTRELVRRLRILGDVQREFRGESMKIQAAVWALLARCARVAGAPRAPAVGRNKRSALRHQQTQRRNKAIAPYGQCYRPA